MEAFTHERAAAIRESLIAVVAQDAVPRSHHGIWGTALVLIGVLAGAGGTAGAFAATGLNSPSRISPAQPSGQPPHTLPDAVPAPAGVTPGTFLISNLGEPFTVEIGDLDVTLRAVPSGATHLRATIVPTAPGSLSLGWSPERSNPTMSATAADISAGSAVVWMDYPVDGRQQMFYLTRSGMEGLVTFQWTAQVPTELGVNSAGETYGSMGAAVGQPDLVAVTAETPDGLFVDGYARATDLNASSPDHAGLPRDPEQALKWQEETQRKYPNGWDIPVYESDGKTQIGVFHIGG